MCRLFFIMLSFISNLISQAVHMRGFNLLFYLYSLVTHASMRACPGSANSSSSYAGLLSGHLLVQGCEEAAGCPNRLGYCSSS